MEQYIHVDEQSLAELKEAISTAGLEYKQQYAKLRNLIEEITSGDIQGELADDLLSKFQAKESTFRGVKDTIDHAEDYMGLKKTGFTTMIDETSGSMH